MKTLLILVALLATTAFQDAGSSLAAGDRDNRPDEAVEVDKVILGIREALIKIEKASRMDGKRILVSPQRLELELQAFVEKSAGAEGGVKIVILTFGAKTSRKVHSAQRIKIVFDVSNIYGNGNPPEEQNNP